MVLGLGLAVTTGSAAHAADSPSDDPTPPPSSGQRGPDPVAPTILDVGDHDVRDVSIAGTGTPGATLRVLDPAVPSRALCEVTLPAATSGSAEWSCRVTLPDGAGQRLTVRDVTNSAVVDDATSASFSVLGPPTVQGGTAVGAKVTGTALPSAVVTLRGGAVPATATADGSGAWSAVLPAASWPTGRYTVTASQSSAAVPAVPRSADSTATVVSIDRDAPAAPVVTSPRAGDRVATQPFVVAGTGEDGATVTAYADSAPVCQATVAGGAWQCTTTGTILPGGTHVVQAAQIDAAVNVGAPSAGVSITVVTAASSAAPPSAAPTPGASPTPAAPGVPTTPDGDDGADAGQAAPPAPGDGDDAGGRPGDEAETGADPAPPTGSWAAATAFGRDLPTPGQAMSGTGWLLALGLAAAFVLLVVAPARLAASALRDRLPSRAPRLTGRNRTVEATTSFSTASLDPRLGAGLTVAAGAAVVAVAAGLDDQVQYARLFAGIVVGVALVNVLAIVLPTVVAARLTGRSAQVRMSPRLLLAAVVACAVTRILGLDPPLVLGVLLVGGLVAGAGPRHGRTTEPDARERGLLALSQVGALVVVSAAAWVVHGLVPDTGGFGAELALETSAAACLSGLGSLVLALVPVGSSPGRQIWGWSRPVHVALTVVGVAVASAAVAGGPTNGFPVGGFVTAAAIAAGLCVAVWLWTSFVDVDPTER